MKILVTNELELQKLPESRGSFYFTDEKAVLFSGITTDLFARINRLKALAEKDDKIRELWDKSVDLTIELRNSDMESLIWYKSLKKSFIPEFNNEIDLSSNFVYLAISFDKAPYITIKEDTQKDLFYVGPFRNRFFARDTITVLNSNLKLPACPDSGFPCRLLESDECKGYCVQKDNSEIKRDIEKYYLSSKNEFSDILSEKFKKLYDDLDFTKAEIVKVEAKILLRYYQYLQFLNETKNLNLTIEFDSKKYKIENGLLAEVQGTKTISFEEQNKSVEFRDNEKLAFNKKELDERWIVYNFVKNVKKINNK